MKIVNKIKTLMTKENIEDINSNEVSKSNLDVIILYCSEFDYDDNYEKEVDILFYLDFDENKVNILDLVAYGTYFNDSHIFRTSYKNLVKMKLCNKSSEIINNFFAKISNVNNLDKVVDNNLDEEELEDVLYSIINEYNGYNCTAIEIGNGVVYIPYDIDALVYEIRKLNGDKEINYNNIIPFTFFLYCIPQYYINSLVGYAEDMQIDICDLKPYHNICNDRYPLSFEGRPYYFNSEEAIYSIINCAKSYKGDMSSILPQGISMDAKFTITLDNIFTCLDQSGNDNFKSFFKEIILCIFTEEEIESLKYSIKKTDEEIENDFDKDIDDIILIEE